MRVRILAKPGYGDKHGNYFERGTVVDWPDPLAIKLLRHGIVELAPDPVLETVAAAPPENTAKRVAKPRTRKGPQ